MQPRPKGKEKNCSHRTEANSLCIDMFVLMCVRCQNTTYNVRSQHAAKQDTKEDIERKGETTPVSKSDDEEAVKKVIDINIRRGRTGPPSFHHSFSSSSFDLPYIHIHINGRCTKERKRKKMGHCIAEW